MHEPTENDFIQLAAILIELLDHPDGDAARRVTAQALRTAYQSGVLAGVDLAATGMQLAAMLDEEEAQAAYSPTSREDGPVYAGPSVDLHDHPSPREAMAAAGWCPK